MRKIFFIFLLIPAFASSQKIHIIKDTTANEKNLHSPFGKPKAVLLSNGTMIYEGQKLPLGKGSLPNGDFNYIATESNTMEAKLKGTTTLTSIQLLYINKKGNRKYGYIYIFTAEGPRNGYLIQLEDAINEGEIVLPSDFANPHL